MRESMVCGNGRVIAPEWLDSAEPRSAERNLRELARVNRWFGGHWVLAGLLRGLVRADEDFTLLDLGAASGDMGASLSSRFPRARVVSLDRSFRHLDRARPPRLVADAFHLPFPDRSFDFAFCSLFLHHFTDTEVTELLARFHALARRALIVIDLERNPLAYYFLPSTRWLFGWDDLIVHDGCVSVEAAFRKRELEQLALSAGLKEVRVRRHYPWFRLSLVAPVTR
jgi:hypothetical protein